MKVTLRVEQSQRRRQRVVGLVPRLHRHPGVAKYTCVYDVQLLAIWRILLLAVVLLLSLALHVGQLQRLPTSPCFSRFRNDRLERRMLCSYRSWFASLHVICLLQTPLPCTFISSGLATFEMPAPPLKPGYEQMVTYICWLTPNTLQYVKKKKVWCVIQL